MYTSVFALHNYSQCASLVIAGPHPGSAEQVGVDRRRDLGEGDRAGAQPPRGQGLRPRPSPHSQRQRRRIRRIQVNYLCSVYAITWICNI